MANQSKTGWGTRLVALLAVAFGVLTLKEGGLVLFMNGAAREAAGNYVPFVLWFNFLAGFAYVVAGIGLWLGKRWAATLAIWIALATALILLAFLVLVAGGAAHEKRTLIALPLRTLVWAGIAWWARRRVKRNLEGAA